MNKQNSLKMKTMPVGKLIAVMSIPAMFSMLIQSLYNIVDSIYVAKISMNSLTALGYAFPMQMIFTAFALGIGIGTNVMVSRKLGEKNPNEASIYAKTGIILAIISGILFFILSFFLVEPYMNLMSDNPEIIQEGVRYLRIVMMFSIFAILEIVCNKLLQAQGRMLIPMFTQLIGAIANIILDPIMIFGLLGFPALGVDGAAIATVFSQLLALTFVILYIATHQLEVHLSLKKFRLSSKYVWGIIRIGLPSTVMNAISSFVNIGLNSIVRPFDELETANTVLASYFKLQSFVFMPVFGLNQGGMPILSYNLGANDKKRFYKAFWIDISTATIILTIGFIIFQIFPNQLLSIFSPSNRMLEIGEVALRRISISFIPAAISVILTMSFQAIGRGEFALIMSLLRQAVILLPSAYFLSKIGLDSVWFAFPIAEYIVAFIFFPLIFILFKKAFLKRNITGTVFDTGEL